jgi:hypothetical protein
MRKPIRELGGIFMSIHEYLSASPLEVHNDPAFKSIVQYRNHKAMDALPFVGSLRKHPYDNAKCLLLSGRQEKAQWPREVSIIEFRISDIEGIDGLATPVDESGTAFTMVKLWVRRGAVAVKYEPFEVHEANSDYSSSGKLHEYLSKAFLFHGQKH